MRDRLHFLFLNIGHFIDHYATLIFATAAALALSREWGLGYAQLAPYATPGFIAFGLFSLPAGWVADRWSRDGMMVVFFVGIGLASIVTGFAASPLQMAIGLFVIGMFAAIYHPVGLAMVMGGYGTTGARNAGMALAINGVWGNLGVASAALVTGLFIDHGGWRAAFIVPGVVSIACGAAYAWLFWPDVSRRTLTAGQARSAAAAAAGMSAEQRTRLMLLTGNILAILMMSGFIFQSTSFTLPKMFDERLVGIAGGGTGVATWVGWMAFLVFAIGSVGQLIIGSMLDRVNIKLLFFGVGAVQVLFFAIMPGLSGWPAVVVASGFMLGAFGQLPITDFMVGRMARSELRASVYGARYVVTCLVFASAIPVIAWIHHSWGFDALFRVLSIVAVAMIGMICLLPSRLPDPNSDSNADPRYVRNAVPSGAKAATG